MNANLKRTGGRSIRRHFHTALAMLGLLYFQRADAASVFEALAIDPAVLGRHWDEKSEFGPAYGMPRGRPGFRLPDPIPYALAVLPSSPEERRKVIEELDHQVAAGRSGQRLIAALLREAWGDRAAAIKLLADGKILPSERLHLVRMLYQSGEVGRAGQEFKEVQSAEPLSITSGFFRTDGPDLLLAIRPFVMREEWQPLAGFLAWLQPRCESSAWRHSVLMRRLDLALHTGTLDATLADLARESAVARFVAERVLTGNSLREGEQLPEANAADLAWILRACRWLPEASGAIEETIRAGTGGAAGRADLFSQLLNARRVQSEAPDPAMIGLVEQWLRRHDEAPALLRSVHQRDRFADIPAHALEMLATAKPEDAYLKLLAAQAMLIPRRVEDADASPGAARARSLLVAAVAHGMTASDPAVETSPFDFDERPAYVSVLLAQSEPGSSRNISSVAARFGSNDHLDPARRALVLLRSIAPDEDYGVLLRAQPEFAQLPWHDQARYLEAAQLDLAFIELLLAVDWTDERHDPHGAWLCDYLSRIKASRRPDGERLNRILASLPVMLLGSEKKAARLIAAHSRRAWDLLLGETATPPGPAVHACIDAWRKGLNQRPGEVRDEVLADCKGILEAKPGESTLPRRPAVANEVSPDARKVAAALKALRWFDPPGLAGLPAAVAPRPFSRDLGRPPGREQGQAVGGLNRDSLVFLHRRYPALEAIGSGGGRLPPDPRVAELALKLRGLLPPDSPMAAAYDIAVFAGMVRPADEATAKQARTHAEGVLTKNRGADFVLLRGSGALLPQSDDTWKELESLATASEPLRAAAANSLRMAIFGARRGPAPEQDRLLAMLDPRAARISQDRQAAAEAARKKEEPYDLLQRWLRAEKQPSEEAITLARQVLNDFARSGARTTTPTENVAISTLARADLFDDFIREVEAAFRTEQRSDLELARAMQALHSYQIVHSQGEGVAFARQVLKLDPEDVVAARMVAGDAVRNRKPDDFLTALLVLRKHDRKAFFAFFETGSALSHLAHTRTDPLEMLDSHHASKLLEMLELAEQPPAEGRETSGAGETPSGETAARMHKYFLAADPSLAARFRKLVAQRQWGGKRPGTREDKEDQLAEDLLAAGLPDELVAFLADRIAKPGTLKQQSPGRLPDVPPVRSPLSPDRFDLWERWLILIGERQLAPRILAELAKHDPAPPADVLAILSILADPTEATYRKHEHALLSGVPNIHIRNARFNLDRLLGKIPAAMALRERILMDRFDSGEKLQRPELESLLKIHLAVNNRERTLAVWKSLTGPDHGWKPRVSTALLGPLARNADDAIWAECCRLVVEDYSAQGTGVIDEIEAVCKAELRPRLLGLFRDMVRKAGTAKDWSAKEAPVKLAGRYMLVAHRLGDDASLRELASRLRAHPGVGEGPARGDSHFKARRLLRQIDLFTGDPAGAFPVVNARHESGSDWTIQWSLAGWPDLSDKDGRMDRICFTCDTRAFDGRFDVAVLAGPDKDALREVTEVPQAAGRGSASVTLPPDATLLTLAAINRETMVEQRSEPIELASLDLRPLALPRPFGKQAQPPDGPFDDGRRPVGVPLSPGETRVILEVPCVAGQPLKFSTWLLVEGEARLELEFRDATDKPVSGRAWTGDRLSRATPYCFPHWELVGDEYRGQEDTPNNAVSAFLVARHERYQLPAAVWLYDPRFEIGALPQLSKAETWLAWLPGTTTSLATSPDGLQIAAGTHRGELHILDADGCGRLTPAKLSGRPLVWVGFAGNRLLALDAGRRLASFDPVTGGVSDLGSIDTRGFDASGIRLALTPDGNWLAWPGPDADLFVARLEADKTAQPVRLPAGANASVWLDPVAGMLHAAGDAAAFTIPLADLPGLDPATIKPVSVPAKTPWQPGPRNDGEWIDPVHKIRVIPDSGATRFDSALRVLHVAESPHLAISASGIVFFTDPFGWLHRLDPEKMEGYRQPE